jgi:glycosyltransferase involved in cell wall biosynthesis
VNTIVHVSTAFSWRGGERQALFLASGLEAEGFSSIAAVRAGSEMHVRCIEEGIPVEPFVFRGEFDVFSMVRLARVLKKNRAVLVHAHDAHGVTFATAAGFLAGVPALATRRVDFPIRSPWKYKRLSRLVCISRQIRSICEESGLDPEEMPVVYSGIDTEWAMGVPSDRNGVLEEFFPQLSVSHLILNVASLVDHKGHKFLVEAMPSVLARFPNAVLLVAGEGELRDSLEILAGQLGVSGRICFAGFRGDVARLIRSCDVYVMPSRMEGLGTSLIDAMAAGKPVVATSAGGMAEVVENGVSGLQVPPEDPGALASAVNRLLLNTLLRESLAAAARSRALDCFDRRRMVGETAEVYREILGLH